jgi:hypothetical protein
MPLLRPRDENADTGNERKAPPRAEVPPLNACPVTTCSGRLQVHVEDGPGSLRCSRCDLRAGGGSGGWTADDVMRKIRQAKDTHMERCLHGAAPHDLRFHNEGPAGPVLRLEPGPAGAMPMQPLLPEFLWLHCAKCDDIELIV